MGHFFVWVFGTCSICCCLLEIYRLKRMHLMNNMDPPAFVSSASCFGLGQSICERDNHGDQQTQEVLHVLWWLQVVASCSDEALVKNLSKKELADLTHAKF